MNSFTISGQLIDIFQRRIYPAEIVIDNGIISSIKEIEQAEMQYILPGFIDAHVHIESSMLTPAAFARLAVIHGTVATVSDPHEIANVCGMTGVQYMIDNSKKTSFKVFFGAPSCVPATSFETAGAELNSSDVEELLKNKDIWYLSEMMNYPGVLNKDTEVMAKIEAAKRLGKPVDGHAPGLKGEAAAEYVAAGITTDHECTTLDEALHKIHCGMKVIIREGSAAKNYEALSKLISMHPESTMFCSDDKHPDELVLGHINLLVKRALSEGNDLFDVLNIACVNPVLHYNIPVGLLREGDPADFIVIDDAERFNVLQTYINGQLVAEKGKSLLPEVKVVPINNFSTQPKKLADFAIRAHKEDETSLRVIGVTDGQLLTTALNMQVKPVNGFLESDTDKDVLKIAVVNRYSDAPVAIGFVKGFGLSKGALASTVAHDSHNIIAIGTDDISLCNAVNALIDCKGGISIAEGENKLHVMPLEVAGLMSTEDGYEVAAKYAAIDAKAKEMGSILRAPFMSLSFMGLLVIPSLKLSDKGLFDGEKFEFTSVEV